MCVAVSKAARIGVAEVLRAGLSWFEGQFRLSEHQWKVLNAILACRTGKLGAQVLRCEDCGRYLKIPLSCRNRHCPSCQGAAAVTWLAEQERALLPVKYFHVVFTLPHSLNPLIRVNQKDLYRALFEAASKTLIEFGRKELGAQIGITAVLHTWGQTLGEHYHLHCIVTGGGLSLDGNRWILPRGKRIYLFNVTALAKMFRGKFITRLKALYKTEKLEFHGESLAFQRQSEFDRLIVGLYRNSWNVYSKPPFAGPQQVLAYLSRYTHRVAISDGRILHLDEGSREVIFSYKDYKNGGRRRTMAMSVDRFIKRLSLHILPKRFTKIRHYGILSTRNREKKIARCRELIGPIVRKNRVDETSRLNETSELSTCPYCHSQNLTLIEVVYGPVYIQNERSPPTAV